ncbi:hypothetical protein CQW23_15311 [Capsicum baccatum]|uniref:Uncharacterized protein n=2 Tax=Capsicum TaxID=4071 RepID=A0A2G2Z9I4_CAPAN|nr:hypothetical protein CQW23_15311 [Capsicum baccatum]PHT78677.1 hypothetical protein T459_16729 [Capsicum annuum]
MRPGIRTLILLLLFLIFVSSGLAYGVNRTYKLHKHVIRENPRKLLQLDAVLDYDNAGPNTKHDPRGKKGGGSGNHP